MTPLRQRMIEDMQVRNLSPAHHRILRPPSRVVCSLLQPLAGTARARRDSSLSTASGAGAKSGLGAASIRRSAPSASCTRKTLGKDWDIDSIPFAKQPKKLPLVLSQDQVHAVLDAITNPQHRVIAMTLYAAGLRVSEAVSLRITDIDSERMLLHVVQGKGRKGSFGDAWRRSCCTTCAATYRRYRPRSLAVSQARTCPDRHVTRDAVAQRHRQGAPRRRRQARIPAYLAALVSLPICWNPVPICAPSRRCSDMLRSEAP